jgi:multimeric flavodoxin WrbA
MVKPRKGQVTDYLSRAEFRAHFHRSFFDPKFQAEAEAIARLEAIAWDNYKSGRKAPITRKAGPSFADPDYDLSVEWFDTHNKINEAMARQRDPASPPRVLVIAGATRNDFTCPGEMSKTFRLATAVRETLEGDGLQTDFLDLSHLASDYGRKIHPCKACVSTAMPLCHWPCSCYPNHGLGQADDWMAEIYPLWAAAHGIVIVTPVYWQQAPTGLKLMIDRLVCADGGNPDPTTTSGKDAEKAKDLELAGWPYPKHLAGRVYGLVVHGDAEGVDALGSALSDWLDTMGLISAGTLSNLGRYIGYLKPYATSHDELDADTALWEEARNVARAVSRAVADLRAGRIARPDSQLQEPRPK